MDETIGNSTLADSYSHLEVVQLLNPKLFNEEWDRGLIFQFVVKLKNSKASQKPSEIWDVLLNSIRANHNQIGQSDLYISYGQPNQEMPLKSTTSQLL